PQRGGRGGAAAGRAGRGRDPGGAGGPVGACRAALVLRAPGPGLGAVGGLSNIRRGPRRLRPLTSMKRSGVPASLPATPRALVRGELTPPAPRASATVLLLRDTPDGSAVHMLRRRASMAFAGGAYAYPGGGVDGRDERPVGWAGPALRTWSA